MATKEHYRRIVVEAGLQPGTDLEDVAAYVLLRAGHDDVAQQVRVGRYRVDFAWPELRVALEVDGPTHFAPTSAAIDAVRDAELRALGWLVFRVDGEAGADGLRAQVTRVARAIHALKADGVPPRAGMDAAAREAVVRQERAREAHRRLSPMDNLE